MKSVVLALALSLSTPPALAQSLPPSFTHSFSLGIAGCVELWGRDNGADVAGRGGCDNPGAQWFHLYQYLMC